MTKVAVMQPYLFPYLGYIQLINAVDEYVLMDDVSWIKRGWINRNTLKDEYLFTIPVEKASQNKKIRDTYIGDGWSKKLNETIKHKYSSAPYWQKYNGLISNLVENCQGERFDLAVYRILNEICSELKITTRLHFASDFQVQHLKRENKIREICKDFNASMYINAIGGKELPFYQPDYFNPIELRFINCMFTLPRTSIIDLLFTYGSDRIRLELDKYELLKK